MSEIDAALVGTGFAVAWYDCVRDEGCVCAGHEDCAAAAALASECAE